MEAPASVQGSAFARAGLLGNPSDGYGGRVIACTIGDFSARVTLRPAERFEVPGLAPAAGLPQLLEERRRASGLSALVLAALAQEQACRGVREVPPFRLELATDVPRQVGFAGSSAVVVATLRAWSGWCGAPLDPLELARLAWDAETVQLGIAAGPQDRLIQSVEGLLDMDFSQGLRAESVNPLPPDLLPPLFLAWMTAPGPPSGGVHADVQQRHARGDAEVRAAMARFASLAAEGRRCLEEGDREGLCRRVDENFDLRAGLYGLGARDRHIVEVGRAQGAAVKFAGSGGGVVGILRQEGDWPRVERAYQEAGYATLRPAAGATQAGSSSSETRRPSAADR